MLIHSASQLLTIAGGLQAGDRLGTLGIIEDGAVLIKEGVIVALGQTAELSARYPDEPHFDAAGRVVMPGFVDPHTHVVWAGDRAAEFEMRLAGKTYIEILQAGGGILSTVNATRAASLDELMAQTRTRLWRMFMHGTTTAEAKTGYGLELETELRQLEALRLLDEEGPWDLAFTFLAAHAIPPEYKDRADEFIDLIIQDMLPEVKSRWEERGLPYVDIFCETGAFSYAQSERLFAAAKEMGFPLKIHADEFDNLGGARLAAEFGAASADHLVATSSEDIQAMAKHGTVAVGLPGTPFGLAEPHYTPAKEILQAGGVLALASDLNPGTTWCENMQMVVALACRYMKLTPAQAIAAATINAAGAINMQDRVGSLEEGKQGDVIVLDVPDYRHLGYRYGTNLVHTVFKQGKKYEVLAHANN